ncbi:MAG: hypothetical protein GF353_11745 [Candidatus Lokiarchaeota archaeon]|nr:hypothetical protein [Candidatus Lokiarchaeota archaeon]
MIKKHKTGKIKLPIFEYSWTKEIKKSNPNLNIIKNQIDSFVFVIHNRNRFRITDLKDEFLNFTKIIIRSGHLSKLNKDDQDKFLIITNFIKDFWETQDEET